MALRNRRAFHVFGYGLVALALASFALRVIFEVVRGNSLGSYRSVTFIQWTYGGAFIVLVILAIVGGIGLAIRAYERFKR